MEKSRFCSVLIPSCDAYSDLWRPFFTLFWRFWPDCPYAVHLGGNEEIFYHPRVTTIRAGHRRSWSDRVREQIAALETPYVLICLEDYFFRESVQTRRVEACLENLRRLDGHMVRLVRRPAPDAPVPGCSELGTINVKSAYRASLQAAIWRVDTFRSLMRDGESSYDFELEGTVRSGALTRGFYSVWEDTMKYDEVVQRGKWLRDRAVFFAAADIGCDFGRREVARRTTHLFRRCRRCVSKVVRQAAIGRRLLCSRPANKLKRLLFVLPSQR